MPRMRTAPGVLEVIKETDPNTEVTLSYLRRLIASGKVPVVSMGSKKLVDADMMIEYIAGGHERIVGNVVPIELGVIRKVCV